MSQSCASRSSLSPILFSALDDEQVQVVVDAMKPIQFKQGDDIILQGDEGDLFYILDEGTCDVYVNKGEEGKEGEKVTDYKSSDYFGDLALMYNAPRAATVKASSATVKTWALERDIFKTVLVGTTIEKRAKYGEWLMSVPILGEC